MAFTYCSPSALTAESPVECHRRTTSAKIANSNDIGSRTIKPMGVLVNSNDIGICTIKPIGEGSCRRLLDDAENIEPSDLTSILGRLPLGVVGGVSDLVK